MVDEAMTVALVEFRFPDGTGFPCLPVRASNRQGAGLSDGGGVVVHRA